MTREGSLEAPKRKPILWEDPNYGDAASIEKEMERQFDVCHGCRRCFNLCASFPTLFDLIDESATGEIDSVSKNEFSKVVDECTLCDMCYMTKCPYVPPHVFDIDFPNLMLRYKAFQFQNKQVPFVKKQLANVDANAALFTGTLAPIVNAINDTNSFARPFLQKVIGIDKRAKIPRFAGKTLIKLLKEFPVPLNTVGIAYGEKAVFYATCYGNYNETHLGYLAVQILSFLGVEVRVEYPGCCAMPAYEIGNLQNVADKALKIAAFFKPMIEAGYTIIPLIPSCALMLKSQWPLLYHDHEDIQTLQKNTKDIMEYIASLLREKESTLLLNNLHDKKSIQDIVLHHACHARAQNMGIKAAEVLKLFDVNVTVVERCSGHGGTWGMMRNHFDTALKIGEPVVNAIVKKNSVVFSSECPLAAAHIEQGLEQKMAQESAQTQTSFEKLHPLEILAQLLGVN